jgi:hypothetical protein
MSPSGSIEANRILRRPVELDVAVRVEGQLLDRRAEAVTLADGQSIVPGRRVGAAMIGATRLASPRPSAFQVSLGAP